MTQGVGAARRWGAVAIPVMATLARVVDGQAPFLLMDKTKYSMHLQAPSRRRTPTIVSPPPRRPLMRDAPPSLPADAPNL
jgi:hypothetical protein